MSNTLISATTTLAPLHRGLSSGEPPVVETIGLTKRYGEFVALSECDLQVPAGQVLGLLGPNGAGKSTLIRLIVGAIEPSAGSARVLGLDCHRQRVEVHRQVSYLPGDARLPKRMKGPEVLRFFAALRSQSPDFGLALAKRMELDLKRRVGAMSTGMRQKLAIAVTLAAATQVVILDEPTANLDPTVRAEVIAMVREAQSRGTTVIFSSHVLTEIEEGCDRVIILRQGKLVHDQSVLDLGRGHRIQGMLVRELPALPESLASLTVIEHGPEQRVSLETRAELELLLPWLQQAGLRELSVEPLGLKGLYAKWHAVAGVSVRGAGSSGASSVSIGERQ